MPGSGLAISLPRRQNHIRWKGVFMKAILKNGLIYPKEPVPADWSEGIELEVQRATSSSMRSDELDHWFEELEGACALMDPKDDRILKDALMDVRRQEKELARKQAAGEG
jgi:hypothetical protein